MIARNNYRVLAYRQIGTKRCLKKWENFVGALDALDWIRRQAEVNGYRDFQLETVGSTLDKPLRGESTDADSSTERPD